MSVKLYVEGGGDGHLLGYTVSAGMEALFRSGRTCRQDAERCSRAAGNIEYEIFTDEGTVIGGGMFTVRPEMFDGKALSVLSGFGGLELSPGSSVSVWFDSTAPAPSAGSKRGASSAAEAQIVDTCTTYCDRCADKTSICTHGVQTYSCSCSDSNRSCTFSCFGGRPPV